MPFQPPSALVASLLGSAGLAFFLASWAWQCRRTKGALELALLMAAVAVYTLGYSLEISRYDLAGVLVAIRLEYLGSVWITPLFLAFSWRYTRGRSLPLPAIVFLLAQAGSALAVVWSPLVDRLFLVNLHVDLAPPFPTIAFDKGPWFMGNYLAVQAEGAAGLLLLVVNAFRAEPLKRRQSVLLALGGSIPLVFTIAYIFGLAPGRIDGTPFALALTGLVCSVALFKYGLLEIVPAARELAIDSLRDGFVVVDERGRVRDANPSARRMLGSSLEPGTSLLDPPPGLGKTPLVPFFRLVKEGKGVAEFVADTPDGASRNISASAQPIMEGKKRQGTALLLHDSTETAGLLARLQELAERDTLTGLLNRRTFMERGQREIELSRREGYPLSAVMVDLDHFKMVNDGHGHAAGDAVLAEAARRLSGALRAVDFVGRYGGEEFAILMPGADAGQARAAAERARQKLASGPVEWEGLRIHVTGSFGVSELSRDSTDGLDGLLKRADAGLYAAKDAGRNRVVGA